MRTVPRSMWLGFTLSNGAATARGLSPFDARPWCDVPAVASNSKPAPRGSRGAGAAALAVSGEEAQHSSLLRVRAVPRWLWSVASRRKALHRREASLLRRAAVVRRASCGLQLKPAPRVSRSTGAPALAVSGEEAQHSSLLRARACRAGCGRLVSLERACTGERPLSFGARPWCDVPAAASNAKPAPRVARRRRAGARCLWGGDAALELAVRARRAALVVVGSCLIERHCTGERPLSFGARPWCDVPAAASNAKPAPRVSRGAGALRSLSLGGGAALELAARARGAALVVVGLALSNGAATARGLSPSARDRGATCQLRPPTASQRRVAHAAQARRRSLSLGRRRSTRACFARAPCRAGCGRLVSHRKACAPARGLSPSARGRGATCQLRPPTPSQHRVCRAAKARRRSLSLGGGAALELAACARVPRWLWSV